MKTVIIIVLVAAVVLIGVGWLFSELAASERAAKRGSVSK